MKVRYDIVLLLAEECRLLSRCFSSIWSWWIHRSGGLMPADADDFWYVLEVKHGGHSFVHGCINA